MFFLVFQPIAKTLNAMTILNNSAIVWNKRKLIIRVRKIKNNTITKIIIDDLVCKLCESLFLISCKNITFFNMIKCNTSIIFSIFLFIIKKLHLIKNI